MITIGQDLHYKLLSMGFKIESAPDEATIYKHADGTTVIIEEPGQKEIPATIKNQEKGDPVTGHCTPKQIELIIINKLILRDAR